jgi:hypothetical protein
MEPLTNKTIVFLAIIGLIALAMVVVAAVEYVIKRNQ